MYKQEVEKINKYSSNNYSYQERFQYIVFSMRWLSILSVNSLMLFNVSFPLLILPSIVNGGEVVAQTTPSIEAERLLKQVPELLKQGTAESKKKAIEILEQTLLLYRKAGKKIEEALILLGVGRIYSDLGQNQMALDRYQQSLILMRQVGNKTKTWQATILNNIGNVYNNLGEKQTALDRYQQSLILTQQVRNKAGEASTLNNIGVIYDSLGEKQTALDHYQQSLILMRQVRNKAGEASTLHNIGVLYYDLEKKQTALDYFNQSLELRQQLENKAGNKAGEARTITTIGRIYSDLGEKQKALDYYNQSLLLSQQVGDKAGRARTLSNIGNLYAYLGKKQSNNSDESVELLRGKQMTRAARQGSVNWERLPGTRIEAEAIVAQVSDPNQRSYALDFEASKETATNEELNQYKFIHFATHGFLNATQPELSGIVMSLVDKNGKQQNGFLYLQDVFNLKLSADLVVLSACETGLGEEVKGEGIVGLTRGFMYAGAPRVVVSLWKVEDNATAQLMTLFYQKMLVKKMNPVAALREAQIEMLNSAEWQDAQYWAAFSLQGEWQ